jgi:hypothetical protein
MAKEFDPPIEVRYVTPSFCNPYGFQRVSRTSCYDTPAPPAYPPGSSPGQPPVTLDLIESGNNTGYCSGDGCLEPTRVETRYDIKYSIPPYGVPVFDWSVSSNAEIVAGGGPTDKYVVIRTESTHDELFSIVLVVKDKNGEHSFQKNATHYVKEKTSSLFVSDIEETLQGHCFYGQGTECTAVSEYGITIQSERMYTIQWYADGASIIGDSNKKSVRVSSTGSEDTTINLRVLVSDGVTTVTKTGTFFHRRSESSSPVSIAGIEETSAGSCSHEPGVVCTASSTYRVDASGGCGGNTYGWSVSSQSGNVHIPGPPNEQTVTVSSTSMDTEQFTLSVTVSDDCGSSDTISRQFSHGREETALVPISITDIYMVSGDDSCEYAPGQTCIASATYAPSLAGNTGSVTYKWSVSGGSIVGADDLSRVTVSTDSDSDTQFNLILDVSDVNSSDRMVKSLTHYHSEKDHVRIDSVTEGQHGSCGYYAGSECTARSTHTVSYSQEVGPVNIQWSVISGNASVVSGGDTDTVIVESDSDTTENFTLGVAVTDDIGNDYAEASFTHDRTENEPISITGINETQAGSCEHPANKECTAKSTHEVTYENDDGQVYYIWTANGATIVGDADKKNVTVETTGETDSTFTLTVTVTDAGSDDTESATFTHTRTEMEGVVILDIEETEHGSCYYLTGSTCEATSRHSVVIDGASGGVTYSWTISGDAHIDGPTDESSVTVKSDSDTDASFTLSVVVTDDIHSQQMSKDFSHSRTEDTQGISVTDILETEHGECEVNGGNPCTAQSRHEANLSGETGDVEYHWEIVSGNATIVTDSSLDYAVVETSSDSDESFELKLVVTDDTGTDEETKEFTHTRTQNLPLSATDITEDESGYCEYN